ncbi:Vegetative incompatibility protein HET-E-1 [Ceratobasidium theobromae]|uniref:Vegetative incompatibility protein HET-E-1 n=1 Tax=Ceratobasidium theobromae TaxID=1582974 RepID=A0A5N5QHT5_9AGAM|nr:Vegetative incompatibility protein HET-E-1 [Ceratobasidium theobromae]
MSSYSLNFKRKRTSSPPKDSLQLPDQGSGKRSRASSPESINASSLSTNVTPHSANVSNHTPDNTQKVSNKTWRGLKTAMQALHISADVFPPLHSAVGGIVSCLDTFEAAARHREDYDRLASDLEMTAELLHQHLQASTSAHMTDMITGIVGAIEQEIMVINEKQIRSGTSRVREASNDEEDLIRCYRRIEQLLHRLQIEVSMSAWNIANSNQVDARLEKLDPARLASYNSKLSTRINRRMCTAHTRKEILSGLYSWSDNANAEKIYWMNGMAGTGKTTIACTISDSLRSHGQLGASFFCTRTSPECRDADRIIPTIAYQLARHSTPFRSALCHALEKEPDASSLNVSTQFERLLKQPLLETKAKLANNLVVVIDALDECDNSSLVGLLLDELFQFAASLPIKFFITSRPEPAIRERMISDDSISRAIFHLHDIETSLVQADIELFLEEELAFMRPSTNQVKQLAEMAGKLFIYAATAVRYIRPGKGAINPRERLTKMLAVDLNSQNKFAPLDQLYSTILDAAFDEDVLDPDEQDRIRLILWTAVCMCEPVSAATLALLSGYDSEDDALAALQPLRSVLYVSEDSNIVSTLHASFPDFMFTPERSGKYFCVVNAHSQLLAQQCFKVMKAGLRFNICNLGSSLVPDSEVLDLKARIQNNISPTLSYACRYWADHLKMTPTVDGLCISLNEFLSQGLLFWMEVLNLKECIVTGVQELAQAQTWLTAANSSTELLKLASDGHHFISRFAAHTISMSTPHIYVSALPFCSPSSSVFMHYQPRMQGLLEAKGPAMAQMAQSSLATWITSVPALSAVFSPDGIHMASGGTDGLLYVRNIRNGKVSVSSSNIGLILSVKYSPDGSQIACYNDSLVEVWRARDSSLVAGPFQIPAHLIGSVGFSAEGRCIVAGYNHKAITIWNVDDGSLITGPFDVDSGPVQLVEYNKVDYSWTYTIHDGTSMTVPYEGFVSNVKSLAFSPDSTRILCICNDRTVSLRNVCDGTRVSDPYIGDASFMAFSPDGAHAVFYSSDSTLSVRAAHDGTLIAGPSQERIKSVPPLAFSPDGRFIVSCFPLQTLCLWNAHDMTRAAGPFARHRQWINSVAFSPDGTQIVSTSVDQSTRIWNVFSEALGAEYHEYEMPLSVAFSPDGNLLASGSFAVAVYVWNAHDGTYIAGPFILEGANAYSGARSVRFSPDSTHITAISESRSLCVWGLDGSLVTRFEGALMDAPTMIDISLDNTHIISCSDKFIKIQNIHDRACIFKTDTSADDPSSDFVPSDTRLTSVGCSPDGAHIASGFTDGTVQICNALDTTPTTHTFQAHTSAVSAVAVSPDGSRIVSGSDDSTVSVWDALDGRPVAGPCQVGGSVSSVAFSPDGRLIVSTSIGGHIHLWNAHDGTLTTSPLQGHTARVSSTAFSHDGTRIVSASDDHSIRVWDVRPPANVPPALVTPQAIREDGWMLNSNSELLFWIPVEIRSQFPNPRNIFSIGPLGPFHVDYSRVLVGEDWRRWQARTHASRSTMSVPDLLLGSLDPSTRQQAEKQLGEAAKQAGFVPHLLGIVLDKAQRSEVRMAAAVYLKNAARRRWADEEEAIPDNDKAVLRDRLVGAMLALSTTAADRTERLARPQLADALAAIAAEDYPERWPGLFEQLTSSLSQSDLNVNVGVLEAAHAVCSPWKSQVRSDKLYATINSVVAAMGEPLLAMFRHVTNTLLGPGAAGLGPDQHIVLAQTLHLLLCLYADLVDQDIPPVFEDSVPEFFGTTNDEGLFLKILAWSPDALKGDPEDASPTPVINAHQVIFEIAELFVLKYNELFESRMPAFIQAVWEMVKKMGPEVREDGVFAQSVRFLSVTVKSGLHTPLFSQDATLQGLYTGIVLPAMSPRTHEVEQFEDDPLEYIRRDLSLSGTSGGVGGGGGSEAGRRGAATELLRALMGIQLEAQVTSMVTQSVQELVNKYKAGQGEDAWQHKDTAVYLMSAVAARSSTLQHGVTSTNIHVDVARFFSEHIAGDLQAAGRVHPILQVDAIRFVHMFRNQFTKEQLVPVLRLLVQHLSSDNYVCCAYAAIAIERILFIKSGGRLVFAQADIHDFANDILAALFSKIESGETPQKVAENDYLMKCKCSTYDPTN